MHMARMPESDLTIVEQLLSASLRDNWSWARVGLDERQKMTNKVIVNVINENPAALEKLAPIADC